VIFATDEERPRSQLDISPNGGGVIIQTEGSEGSQGMGWTNNNGRQGGFANSTARILQPQAESEGAD
jgi:hypothetical protein